MVRQGFRLTFFGCLLVSVAAFARPVVVGIPDVCFTNTLAGVRVDYADAVYAAGAVPYVLPETTNALAVAALLDRVDMLLFCGGEDVEPARYGEKPAPRLGTVNARRDAWEWRLLNEATRRRLPILGVCRGCQLVNAYFGGTLWQDLPSEFEGGPRHRLAGEHPIAVEGESYLARLVGGKASVNSRHHQAVKRVADGFKVTARSPEGVVEAIEGSRYPAVGVQFHPETMFAAHGVKDYLPLFRGDFAASVGKAQKSVSPSTKKLVVIPDYCATNRYVVMKPNMAAALEQAGFVSVVVPFTGDDVLLEAAMAGADALMVAGGIGGLQDYSRRCDFEQRMIALALKRGLPICGVCHGSQVINVHFGGTLKVTPQKAGETDYLIAHRMPVTVPYVDNFHLADLVPGSRIAMVLGSTRAVVNSSHSNRSFEMGKGLKVTARAPDGVVEAFEHETLPVMAFQFHPERMAYDRRFVELLRVALSPSGDGADRPWRVFNEDNDRWFCVAKSNEVCEAGLRAYIDGIADRAAPTHMFLCPCGQRASFDSKAWEPIWAGLNDPDANGRTNHPWCANAKRLHDQGVDAYRVWIDQCRRRGISPWLSMRMNDDHIMIVPHYFRNETFWREHPEFRRHPELDPWAPDAVRNWSLYSFDYTHPEVREHQFAMFRELAERYDADGIELDWLRCPGVFAPGKEREGLPLITDFMRRCRREADAVAARRGRPLPLAVRLPVLESACKSYGFDPLTWAKERLVDVFTFSDGGSTADFDVDAKGWRERLGKVHPGVRVLVGTDTSYACAPQSKFRGLELNDLAVLRGWLARYADEPGGLYFFNAAYLPQASRDEMFGRPLADGRLSSYPRRFLLSFHDYIGIGVNSKAYWRLPASLAKAQVLTVQAVPGLPDKSCEVVLGFDGDAAALTDLAVTLNGVSAEGVAARIAETQPYSNLAKDVCKWRFPVAALRKGGNAVAIPAVPASPVRLVWCEIAAR